MTTHVTPDVMAALQTTLRDVFAQWVRELELRLIDASPGEVRLALPVHPRHVHAGNVMSGQTLMAAADSAASPAAAPVETAAPPSRCLRILVVDDDPLVLQTLTRLLEADGHAVVAANAGQAGIDAFTAAHARGEDFSLVLTDLGMPHVDGRKVAGAVKQASPSTPVIMLTGWGQGLGPDGDTPLHVDQILGKPPKLAELRQALSRHGGSA